MLIRVVGGPWWTTPVEYKNSQGDTFKSTSVRISLPWMYCSAQKKRTKSRYHLQTRFTGSKCAKNAFAPGCPPRTPPRELTALPQTPHRWVLEGHFAEGGDGSGKGQSEGGKGGRRRDWRSAPIVGGSTLLNVDWHGVYNVVFMWQ